MRLAQTVPMGKDIATQTLWYIILCEGAKNCFNGFRYPHKKIKTGKYVAKDCGRKSIYTPL
jgi:hypothetical protein